MTLRLSAIRSYRVFAQSLLLANNFKEVDRYKATRSGYARVAGLVPFRIVFPAQDMKEIAFLEGQLLPIWVLWLVVVKRPDHLLWRNYSGCRFRGYCEMRWKFRVLFILERSAQCLEVRVSATEAREKDGSSKPSLLLPHVLRWLCDRGPVKSLYNPGQLKPVR